MTRILFHDDDDGDDGDGADEDTKDISVTTLSHLYSLMTIMLKGHDAGDDTKGRCHIYVTLILV